MPKKFDPLMPDAAMLIKIGSLIVHYQEYTSPAGHTFDKTAIDTLEADKDVQQWLYAMSEKGFLPLKRN